MSAPRAQAASYGRRMFLPRDERAARRRWGMAPAHPERITAVLPGDDEADLGAWCAEMWPEDEYLDLIPVPGQDGAR